MNISERHHYLPEFFIEGFTDDDGIFWVYDKLYDKIIPKPQTKAMRFYEKKRNTITIEGEEVDIIEKAYQQIEDKVKTSIINSRTVGNLDDVENLTNIGYLLTFIVFTFWRIPENDALNKSLLKFYKDNRNDWDSFAKLALMENISEDDKIKIAKTFIPIEILKEGIKFNGRGEKTRFRIVDFKAPIFLISDNPVLLPKIPNDINDFQNSLIFPICKSRAFVFLEGSSYTFDEDSIKTVDLLLIHQAKRYVGFHNRKMLEEFVTGYRHFKNIGEHTNEVKKQLFEKVNQQKQQTEINENGN